MPFGKADVRKAHYSDFRPASRQQSQKPGTISGLWILLMANSADAC
jgi:hypothetical protein